VALEDDNRLKRLVQAFGTFTGFQRESAWNRIPPTYRSSFSVEEYDTIRCSAQACPCPPSIGALKWPIGAKSFFGQQCLMCDDEKLQKTCTTAEGRRRVVMLLLLMPLGVQEVALTSRLPIAFAQELRVTGLEGYYADTEKSFPPSPSSGEVREHVQSSGSREQAVPTTDGDSRETLPLEQCPEVHLNDRNTEARDYICNSNESKLSDVGAKETVSVDVPSGDVTTSRQVSEAIPFCSEAKRRKIEFKNISSSPAMSIVARPSTSQAGCRLRMTPEDIYGHELTLRHIKDQLDEDGAVDDQEFFEDLMHQFPLNDRQLFGLPEVIDRAAFSSDGKIEYELLMMAVANAKQSHLEDFVASAERCRWGSMHSGEYDGFGLLKALHTGGFDFEELQEKIDLLFTDVDVNVAGDDTGSSQDLFTLQMDFLKSHTDKVGAIALFTQAVSFLEDHAKLEPEAARIATYLATLDDSLRKAMGMRDYNVKMEQKRRPKNWKADVKKYTMFLCLSYRAHHVHELRAVMHQPS
jgi:hypothetical protein